MTELSQNDRKLLVVALRRCPGKSARRLAQLIHYTTDEPIVIPPAPIDEPSLTDTGPTLGGRGILGLWPVGLDERDPEGIADFCLGLGYTEDQVTAALVDRCSIDRITARRIVKEVASTH